tara:strand:- start:2704 stop:3651 length:948 start_codon:yes stop_codon:yes gene_type:complete
MILQKLTEDNIINYGDFKSKNGTKMDFYINENNLIGNPQYMNFFIKNLNKNINHCIFDGLMAIDIYDWTLTASLSSTYNYNSIYLKNSKIYGSRKIKKIIVVGLKYSKTLENGIKYLESQGFIVEKIVLIFEMTKETNTYNYLFSYATLMNYKPIAHFQNQQYFNNISNNLSSNIIKYQTNKFKYYSRNGDNNYPCLYFNDKNIDLINNSTETMNLYFKVLNESNKKNFFNSINKIIKNVDIIVLHLMNAKNNLQIINKIRKKIGVIIYFENDDEESNKEFNSLVPLYKNHIIGTLNKSTCSNQFINFNTQIEFI